MTEREDENAYEKLSREVHQMQITGAIHSEWLENPRGFLLKPDFKRKMQHMGAGGKKLQHNSSMRTLRLHLPGSTYKSRWFILDGMILRYFKNQNDEQELGAIHLASVNAVLPSSIADAPEHSLDLVCADRIYTIAAATREDMVRWATVLTLVLRGEYQPKLMQRRESTIIRGSSVIPSRLSITRSTQSFKPNLPTNPEDDPILGNGSIIQRETVMEGKQGTFANNLVQVKEKLITVTFDTYGPLYLILQSNIDDNVMVCGFQEPPGGGIGMAEATGSIKVGDILVCINDDYFHKDKKFEEIIYEMRNAKRPLTLRFSRLDMPIVKQQSRIAEGWVLSKEPDANRYRVRMLQLHGSKLNLYKPGLYVGRLDKPCFSMELNDVTDIRPSNDKREVASAHTQCHSKRWGITLEGKKSLFTFYPKNKQDMLQWVDILRNAPIFDKSTAMKSIPTHPIMVVNSQSATRASVILQGNVSKLGDLTNIFETRFFILHQDGKIFYYLNRHTSTTRIHPLGTIKCDSIVTITPIQYTDSSINNTILRSSVQHLDQYDLSSDMGNNESTNINTGTSTSNETLTSWQLELGVIISTSAQKYRRLIVLSFENQDVLMKWARAIEKVSRYLTGREYDLEIIRKVSSTQDHKKKQFRPIYNLTLNEQYAQCYHSLLQEEAMFRHLGEINLRVVSRGWFFVKKPDTLGIEAYHPRYLVLKENRLLLYKYEVLGDEPTIASGEIDLKHVKDVRESDTFSMDKFDYSIELTTSSKMIFTIAAQTYQQKEVWLTNLIWASDFYYEEIISKSPPKLLSANSDLTDIQSAMQQPPNINNTLMGTNYKDNLKQLWQKHEYTINQIRGYVKLSGKEVYGVVLRHVFSYYHNEEEYENEWGDAIDAISLTQVMEVHSDGFTESSFTVVLKNNVEVQFIASNVLLARKWMLALCCNSNLVLMQTGRQDSWASIKPKEEYIWKLDRLYQIHRKRFFSLQNHQLLYYSCGYTNFNNSDIGKFNPNDQVVKRLIGLISLQDVAHIMMTNISGRSKDDSDYFQLTMHCSIPTPTSTSTTSTTTNTNTAINNSLNDTNAKVSEDFYSISLAFHSENKMKEWAQAIYECCMNCTVTSSTESTLVPPTQVHILPQELLKTTVFLDMNDKTGKPIMPLIQNPRGWLYYRTNKDERLRKRYFVLQQYELSIYKHELLPDESTAIRYGALDCRALTDVSFVYTNCPENLMQLTLNTEEYTISIIPPTDQEAEMWQLVLRDAKQTYNKNNDTIFNSFIISRSSTFETPREQDELLRNQMESVVLFSANLQEWDGSKFVAKYFVLTQSRVLVFSLAVHMYDEESDLLSTFVSKTIKEVRFIGPEEETEIGQTQIFAFLVLFQDDVQHNKRCLLRCETLENCIQWMKLLCHSNGKLELKKNAASGAWGSVNRITSMSRHSSFLLNKNQSLPIMLDDSAQKGIRQSFRMEAARRRTSELLKNRNNMDNKLG